MDKNNIELDALAIANAKIQELQEQLSKSKNVVTPEENELASLRNFKDFFQPRMTELKSKLTHETNMASNYCELANKQAGEILQLNAKITELEQQLKKADDIIINLVDAHDVECRLDHHGICQAHYLESECSVKAGNEYIETHIMKMGVDIKLSVEPDNTSSREGSRDE